MCPWAVKWASGYMFLHVCPWTERYGWRISLVLGGTVGTTSITTKSIATTSLTTTSVSTTSTTTMTYQQDCSSTVAELSIADMRESICMPPCLDIFVYRRSNMSIYRRSDMSVLYRSTYLSVAQHACLLLYHVCKTL